MQEKLPKKLTKEPLVDAIFELRFTSVAPASNILPGILFGMLPGEKNIEKLPAAELPEQLRATDPNLQYAPLIRLNWEQFVLLISDRSIAVACKIPYPGWTAFKSAILTTMDHIKAAGIIKSIQRYSLKYVDLVPSNSIQEQVSLVNLDLRIGAHRLEKEFFQVRIDVPINGLVNVIQVISNAELSIVNMLPKKGIIIDIDTINNVDIGNIDALLEALPTQLENMHETNCEMFFDCLKPETIKALEPIYE